METALNNKLMAKDKKEILKMIKDTEMDNSTLLMEINMKEILKMIICMDLAFYI